MTNPHAPILSLTRKFDLSKVPKTALLIFGLPGSGKTTLSETLVSMMHPDQVIVFNADKVRSTLSKDLKFRVEDRVEQARRMGCVASLALDASSARVCIVDFVNPNVDTWTTFQANLKRPVGNRPLSDVNRTPGVALEDCDYPVFSVWMNTIGKEDCRYVDTAELFARGERPVDVTVNGRLEGPNAFGQVAIDILQQIYKKGL